MTTRLLLHTNMRLLMERCNLRQVDVAWICGVDRRTVVEWLSGRRPIQPYASLLLQAFEEGLLSAKWIADRLDTPPPR